LEAGFVTAFSLLIKPLLAQENSKTIELK